MIRNALSVDLATKIALSLEGRIAKASDGELATEDLARARRLLQNGQLTRIQFKACIDSLMANERLSEDTKAAFRSEHEEFQKAHLLNVGTGKTAEQRAFESTQVLIPRSAIVPGGNEFWTPIHPLEAEGLLSQISPIDNALIVSPAATVCEMRALPWYGSAVMIRIYDERWPIGDLVVYYIIYDNKLFRLAGASPPIHEVNAKAPIKLTRENALDYLRFFCFFVRGEEGPFYILESEDDPFLERMLISDTVKSVIKDAATPAKLVEVTEEGNFNCEVIVFYSNALFKSTMQVQPTGMIEMLDDDPIAADLPARIKAPLGYVPGKS